MALNSVLLAPTKNASVNVVSITVPAGSTATLAVYTALGGDLPDLPQIEITHKNPAGTFQNTGFIFGPGNNSTDNVRQPQFIVGPGEWSINKPVTSIEVGLMLDQ